MLGQLYLTQGKQREGKDLMQKSEELLEKSMLEKDDIYDPTDVMDLLIDFYT